ncbi:hypothetical protein KEM56_002325 [Ascosphaera pollenicola]|nr:hypothetical protein KEM56_002325 [Ascosphaera pollenicola]
MARLAKDAVSSDSDSDSSSDTSSGSSSDSSAANTKSAQQIKKEKQSIVKKEPVSEDEKMGSGSESESESESESDSESSSSSQSESEEEEVVHRNDDIQKAIDAKNAQTGAAIQAKPFKPPGSFKKVQASTPVPSELSQVLSGAGNKQIWHITAPASVPLSSINQLALDAVATGQPVLSHKGVQYKLREEQLGSDTTKHLLLPDKFGTTYKKDSLRVVQTFHLEKVLDITPSETAPSQGLIDKYKKPVRQQPKNLKARNTPIGVKDDDESTKPSRAVQDSDIEMGDVSTKAHEESKKRKHLETELPLRKKSKTATDGSKKERKSKHGEETSEERKARREEKKRKKAQQQA